MKLIHKGKKCTVCKNGWLLAKREEGFEHLTAEMYRIFRYTLVLLQCTNCHSIYEVEDGNV